MNYYLDTNIIIYFLNGRYPEIEKHFSKVPSTSILIPDIVLAEIEYGARKSNKYDKTIKLYSEFTNAFHHCSMTAKSIKEYGIIRSELEKKGNVIGANDLIIAAIVKSEGGILVTHNTKEFSKISGLKIEDWTQK